MIGKLLPYGCAAMGLALIVMFGVLQTTRLTLADVRGDLKTEKAATKKLGEDLAAARTEARAASAATNTAGTIKERVREIYHTTIQPPLPATCLDDPSVRAFYDRRQRMRDAAEGALRDATGGRPKAP